MGVLRSMAELLKVSDWDPGIPEISAQVKEISEDDFLCFSRFYTLTPV